MRTTGAYSEEGGSLSRSADREGAAESAPLVRPSLSLPVMAELEALLDHSFVDRSLLVRALTHSSRAHEEGDSLGGNERLEFLGDAVIDLVVSEFLMELRRDAREGVLSQARAAAVNQTSLARVALELGLQRFIRLGRGEAQSGGNEKPSILANVFEAVVGALYLDGGLDVAADFLERSLRPVLANGSQLLDAKTRLQEWLQKRGRAAPQYRLLEAEGPDHAREFRVCVETEGERLADGSGRSKREAEQAAAGSALAALGVG